MTWRAALCSAASLRARRAAPAHAAGRAQRGQQHGGDPGPGVPRAGQGQHQEGQGEARGQQL